MGAILGAFSLASWVPCLCSGASCLLCSCGPVSENPTVIPLIYASMLILGTFTSCIMMTEGVQTQLKKIPGFCEGRFQIKMIDTKAEKECDVLVGFKAVYWINFAVAIFFFAFFLLKLKVKTSKDPRAAVHNGFWFFKITAIIGIMVASFYIPGGHFTKVWFGAGMLGATFFIFIQLVLLVDVAHSRNESWVIRMEEGNPRLWYAALLPFTTLLYILSIVFAVLLYIFYTKPDGCTEKKVFISPSLVFCVAVSIVSILPKVQEHQPHSGLLQSSIIAVHTLYLTWSAMTNEPELSCNPSLMDIITHLISPTVSSANSTTLAPACAPPPQNGHFMNLDDIWGLIIFIFCLIYSSICTLSNNQVNKLTLSGSDSVILADTTSGASDEDGQPR